MPTFDSKISSAGFGFAGSGSPTEQLIVGNNPNRAVFVWLGFQLNGGASFGSVVTCGGVPMTKFPGTAVDTDSKKYKELWWLPNPSVGSKAIAFTANNSDDKPYISAVSYYDVHQTDPFNGRTALAFDQAVVAFPRNNPNISVTSTVGELVIDHLMYPQPSLVMTPNGTQTMRENAPEAPGIGGCGQSEKAAAGAAGTATGMSWGISFADPFLYTGISIKSATGGGGATALTLSGPSSGAVGVASTNFTVGVDTSPVGAPGVTVTPHSSGAGSFTPATVNLSPSVESATFTFTPIDAGAHSITLTSNSALTNPAAHSYNATGGVATVKYRLGTDITAGGWTTNDGTGSLASKLDEVTPDVADFIKSSINPSDDACEIQFVGVQTPGTLSDMTLRYMLRSDPLVNQMVQLVAGDGTTVVATWNHGPVTTDTQFDRVLSAGQMSALNAAGFVGCRLRNTADS